MGDFQHSHRQTQILSWTWARPEYERERDSYFLIANKRFYLLLTDSHATRILKCGPITLLLFIFFANNPIKINKLNETYHHSCCFHLLAIEMWTVCELVSFLNEELGHCCCYLSEIGALFRHFACEAWPQLWERKKEILKINQKIPVFSTRLTTFKIINLRIGTKPAGLVVSASHGH